MEGDFTLKPEIDIPMKPGKQMDQQDSTTAERASDSCPTVETGKEMNDNSTKNKMQDLPGKLDQPEKNNASLIMQEPEPENRET